MKIGGNIMPIEYRPALAVDLHDLNVVICCDSDGVLRGFQNGDHQTVLNISGHDIRNLLDFITGNNSVEIPENILIDKELHYYGDAFGQTVTDLQVSVIAPHLIDIILTISSNGAVESDTEHITYCGAFSVRWK